MKIKRDSTPQSPNTSEGNNRPRPPPARNSKFGKGKNGNNIIVFPKRRRLVLKLQLLIHQLKKRQMRKRRKKRHKYRFN